MCLIIFSWKSSGPYKLILAANRDESFNRDTLGANCWIENRAIYGGRDVEKNGSWLAIKRDGRWAAITNVKQSSPTNNKEYFRSRGLLVRDYLMGNLDPQKFNKQIKSSKNFYQGYNLLMGDRENIYYKSNRKNIFVKLRKGVLGLSNDALNCPWPKVVTGRALLRKIISKKPNNLEEHIFQMMYCKKTYPNASTSNVGFKDSLKEKLSSRFVQTGTEYGTRSMSLITISYDNHVTFQERIFGKNSEEIERSIKKFQILNS